MDGSNARPQTDAENAEDSLIAALSFQRPNFAEDFGFISSSLSSLSHYVLGERRVEMSLDRAGDGLRHARGRVSASGDANAHPHPLPADEAMHSLQMHQTAVSGAHVVPVLRTPPSSRPVSLQRRPVTAMLPHPEISSDTVTSNSSTGSSEETGFERVSACIHNHSGTTTYTTTVTDYRQRQVSVTAVLSPDSNPNPLLPLPAEGPYLCPDRTLERANATHEAPFAGVDTDTDSDSDGEYYYSPAYNDGFRGSSSGSHVTAQLRCSGADGAIAVGNPLNIVFEYASSPNTRDSMVLSAYSEYHRQLYLDFVFIIGLCFVIVGLGLGWSVCVCMMPSTTASCIWTSSLSSVYVLLSWHL